MLAAIGAVHCKADPVDCNEALTCNFDSGMMSTDGGSDVVAPPGCDTSAEPKVSPNCVVDSYGVFVDGNAGADTNAGTKAAPLRTISAALGKTEGKPRIYVCASTYPEHVKLSSTTSIYGGFKCADWSYTGDKTSVAPSDVGYALEAVQVSGVLEIADLAFTAVDGIDSATSSVAAFIHGSPSLTLRRVTLTAGKGFKGKTPAKAADGALMSSTPGVMTLNGNKAADPPATTGALAQSCTCVGGGTSKGGAGGNGGFPGGNGETAQTIADPAGADGAGGTTADCSKGTPIGGHGGSNAPDASPAMGAVTLGNLTEAGWTPGSDGAEGTGGAAGQGGGGGAGIGGGGGSGGCGGCGGAGGAHGDGGGASVALLTFESPILLIASTLVAADAGAGAQGGPGGSGTQGGTHGAPSGGACIGGNGGTGGAGGQGGGGAGGVSVGVLAKGGKPTVDAVITVGTKGTPGNGAVDGQATNSLDLQ